jgi:hypothetical protein
MESDPPPHTSSGSSPAACQQCWHPSPPRLSSEASTPCIEKENARGKNLRCRRAPYRVFRRPSESPCRGRRWAAETENVAHRTRSVSRSQSALPIPAGGEGIRRRRAVKPNALVRSARGRVRVHLSLHCDADGRRPLEPSSAQAEAPVRAVRGSLRDAG